MESFLDNITSNIGITDALDILIVSFVIYKILGFIQESRAQQLVKGLLVLVVAFFASDWLHLYTLHWILKGTVTLGVIALVVVFQPELRRGLEYVGQSKIVKPFSQIDSDEAKQIIDHIITAVLYFSQTNTGALLVFERETPLKDFSDTGTIINAYISAQMLGNIFYEGAPLHDGAVILRSGRIFAAGCVLPLTGNKDLDPELGTRHRAGIGITENSDALTIIVSEETGTISLADHGKLTRNLKRTDLEEILFSLYIGGQESDSFAINNLGRILDKLGRKKDAQ
ncbi:MAG: diadenylate cyclase CdaA [Peptostreptococcaceae bacterium]|nr:diadenylate cyclase CdaA [Peptostreptococcaceae bacterium]MDY5739462.1 diadenylate cyclase CdaA [Anaerovoracaceae bacterium]SFE04432.1 diadenylate cyclase [Peptostreptococcaceae bacterium pGA-8]